MNLNSGVLAKKSDADLCIFDLNFPWKINPEQFYSKSKNTPFDSLLVEGKNMLTFVKGRLVFKKS